RPPRFARFPYTTLFRSEVGRQALVRQRVVEQRELPVEQVGDVRDGRLERVGREAGVPAVEVAAVERLARLGVDDRVVVDAVELRDRKSTRLNSSHVKIS